MAYRGLHRGDGVRIEPGRGPEDDTARRMLCGALGYSKDTPLEWIYRYARQARLVDGASEVHKGVLANYLLEERDAFCGWDRLP